METLINDQWAALGEVDSKHAIKLVIDEWGSWHPEGTEINKCHLFEQMGTLRDALVAAISLDTFNRHADKVDMANVAQLVNNLHSLFLADGDNFVATPTFFVYKMYRAHRDAKAGANRGRVPGKFQAGGKQQQIFRLAGSASVTPSKAVTLTLVHTHATDPAEVVVRIKPGNVVRGDHTVLTHAQPNAHNTFAEPARVLPSPSTIAPAPDRCRDPLCPAPTLGQPARHPSYLKSAPGLSWSPGREVRPRLLKVDPQDSTEFVRDSLLAYLGVEAWNDHLRRGRGEVRALVGDHPVATPVGHRMLQLEHDGVVGHARVDRGPAQRLDDPAGWAEVAQAERLAAKPSV